MKKNKTAKTGIIVAILLLAVGFAAISTTLVINGTAKIKPDEEDFKNNVIFTAVDVDATSKAAGATATVSEDGKTITFTTQEMDTIGAASVLTYKIKNSSQYDATIGEIVCKAPQAGATVTTEEKENSDALDKYITLTPTKNLNGVTIAAGETSTQSDTVTVSQKRSFVGDETNTTKTITFECSIVASAAEAE